MNKKNIDGLEVTNNKCSDDGALASLEHGPDMQLEPEVADQCADEVANPFYLSEESDKEEADTPKFSNARPQHF